MSLGCEGEKGEGKEKKSAEEEGDIPNPRRLAREYLAARDVCKERQS